MKLFNDISHPSFLNDDGETGSDLGCHGLWIMLIPMIQPWMNPELPPTSQIVTWCHSLSPAVRLGMKKYALWQVAWWVNCAPGCTSE